MPKQTVPTISDKAMFIHIDKETTKFAISAAKSIADVMQIVFVPIGCDKKEVERIYKQAQLN